MCICSCDYVEVRWDSVHENIVAWGIFNHRGGYIFKIQKPTTKWPSVCHYVFQIERSTRTDARGCTDSIWCKPGQWKPGKSLLLSISLKCLSFPQAWTVRYDCIIIVATVSYLRGHIDHTQFALPTFRENLSFSSCFRGTCMFLFPSKNNLPLIVVRSFSKTVVFHTTLILSEK